MSDFSESENVGYRALLKRYLRHLNQVQGDNYLGVGFTRDALTRRDRQELLVLAAEVDREDQRLEITNEVTSTGIRPKGVSKMKREENKEGRSR